MVPTWSVVFRPGDGIVTLGLDCVAGNERVKDDHTLTSETGVYKQNDLTNYNGFHRENNESRAMGSKGEQGGRQ